MPDRLPRGPAFGGLLSRPVHVPELFLRPLGLALQVHALRFRPPLAGVAVPDSSLPLVGASPYKSASPPISPQYKDAPGYSAWHPTSGKGTTRQRSGEGGQR